MTEYAVRVNQIGGFPTIVDLSSSITDGIWRHDLDGLGEATVRSQRVDTSCCGDLAMVRPWLHELQIQRDGKDVFVGPITTPLLPVTKGGTLEITAGDMPVWFTVRFARNARNWTVDGDGAAPIEQIVADIINMSIGPADPNMLDFTIVQACGQLHERVVDATDGIPRELAWKDHLAQIVGKLMHMSVHGRETLFYCPASNIGDMPDMNDLDFESIPPMLRDGDRYATHVAVIGDTLRGATFEDPDITIAGIAGGINSLGLLVERVETIRGLRDQASAVAAARVRLTSDAPLSTFDIDGPERLVLNCDSALYPRFHKVRPGLFFNLTTSGCVGQASTVRVDYVGASWRGKTEQAFLGVSQAV